MKKGLVLFCFLTIVFFLSGYNELITSGQMRTRMTVYNQFEGDQPSSSYIDSRLRLQFTNLFNERLQGVFKMEIGDIRWGDTVSGGDLGTDDVNIETKNLYFDFKCDRFMFDIRVGLQTVKEHTSLVLDDDMAAFLIKKELGTLQSELGYGKLEEKNISLPDDRDIFWFNLYNNYVGFNSILTQNYVPNDQDKYSFWFIPYYLMQANEFSLDLSLLYNNGYWQDGNGFYGKNQGFGVDAKLMYQQNGTKLKAEVLYLTGDDDYDDNEYSYFSDLSEYYFNGLEIFGRGVHDGVNQGWIGASLSGKFDVIVRAEHQFDRFTYFANLGFMNFAVGDEKHLGKEMDAGIKIDLCEALEFYLVGAYALLNDDLEFDDDLFEFSSKFEYTFD